LFSQGCHDNPGGLFLFGGMVEDGGAVLSAGVASLAVQGGRIMDGEEYVQKVRIRDDLRVKTNLNDLGMTGGPFTDLAIAGVGDPAARVTGLHFQNPF
jgi:hypothetical protein